MSSKKAEAGKDSKAEIRAVVRRYYEVLSDPGASPDDLAALLDKKVAIHEHPNLITPTGITHGRAETLEGFVAGRELFSEQAYEVHEILVSGDRAAVRCSWRGRTAQHAGPLRAGSELAAHVAAFLTVRDSRIVEFESYDCYEQITSVDENTGEHRVISRSPG